MVKFTIEEVRNIMNFPDQIRNMSVIAHVDHGKSTLTDSLVAAAGIIAVDKAGETRICDTRDDEQLRCITIKSTAISLYFRIPEHVVRDIADDHRHHLINLIDSPGHVDFSSEVTAALRVTDGALVVVDCVEGVCVQTETVLRQALTERIRPCLHVNKLDRAIRELQFNGEEAYNAFNRVITQANVIIATFQDAALGEVQVDPTKGTVTFGSGLQAWGFGLERFATLYSKKFGIPQEKLMQKLWGDNFFDKERKVWVEDAVTEDGRKLPRAFCQFIWEPIKQLFDAVLNEKGDKVDKIVASLEITLKAEERARDPKALLKTVLQRWLPASDALLSMIVQHLPSPRKAQAYRTELLYTGPLDDQVAASMRECNQSGPLMVYVSKMVPSTERGRFTAMGRVFSGTVESGQKVRIMGANYVFGGGTDAPVRGVQRVVVMMGRYQEAVRSIPAGNIVGLQGIDQGILKTASIVDADDKASHPLRDMKYSVSPVVRVAVEPKVAADLPKLIEGLKRLSKADPLVVVSKEESGEHVVAGAGELHLEICLKDLQEAFMGGAEIKVSDPVVSYRETVSAKASSVVLAKSSNKHNRMFARSEPLGDEFVAAVEGRTLNIHEEPRLRGRVIADTLGWDVGDARSIWCFAPDGVGPNVLVDVTKAVSNMQHIRDGVVHGFDEACRGGPMAGEEVRGVRHSIEDFMLHNDAVHRGGAQIIPMAKRNVYAGILSASPRVMEPFFRVEVQTVESALGSIYSVLSKRRGVVVEEVNRPGTTIYTVSGFLPVAESFGFTQELRGSSGGQAFPQSVFDHWAVVAGDPLAKGSAAAAVVAQVRARKGMSTDMHTLDFYNDRL